MSENLKITDLVRAEVREMTAYHTPEVQDFIKLDAMENPYHLPPVLVNAWLESLRTVAVNRYPDGDCKTLKTALRHHFAIPDDLQILLGNGSDELIQLICMTLSGPNRLLLAPEPSFSMYPVIAKTCGLRYCGVSLDDNDFSLASDAMIAAIQQHQPALVILSNPNNPTGNLFEEAVVLEILQQSPGVVVLDEAYFHFSGQGFIDKLSQFPNALVMRTLSKMGMAGLRVGMLVGHNSWIETLNKLRLPYNINSLSQASAVFLLAQSDYYKTCISQILTEREKLYQALNNYPGLVVWPTSTNFILFRVLQNADKVYQNLYEHRILVKNLSHAHPLLWGCLRVSIGNTEENKRFLLALSQSL